MSLLILFFLLSIIFSFLCSIWESLLLSIPPSYVEVKHEKGGWSGKRLKYFKENIDRPLAGILTLNTIAHTVGAIGVGAQAAELWGKIKIQFFFIDISMEAVIAGAMTLAILILSEIIPKTVGARFWKGLTDFTVYGVHVIIIILYPLVWLAQGITLLLKNDDEKSVLSRTDFSTMARIGARDGALKKRNTELSTTY